MAPKQSAPRFALFPKIGSRRHIFVPEMVQSSAMDCGPASLKCLLEGFRIPVSYGRLREACQTDVDGTSINTLEEVAIQLGLEAEQIMLPIDHVLLTEARALPSIITTRHSSGATHFMVAWRRHGGFIQVMDPATGRRWPKCRQFIHEVYIHIMPVPAAAWRQWTSSDEFLAALCRRMRQVGTSKKNSMSLIQEALQDPGWHSMAALDGAVRMTGTLVRSGGTRYGRQATRVIESFFMKSREAEQDKETIIPPSYWSVRPGPPVPKGEEQILFHGAVLIRVRGRAGKEYVMPDKAPGLAPEPAAMSLELAAALNEPSTKPLKELFRLLRHDGLLSPVVLVIALAVAAAGVIIEALLFRGLFDLSQELGLAGQRFEVMGALLVFAAAMLILELPIATTMLRLGRHLESRLRIAFLEKIPRLNDRYFQSRLTSDMAERSHSVHNLRSLPALGGQFVRSIFELVLTTTAIAWIYPQCALIAMITAILSVILPLMANPYLSEKSLRVRNHGGALSRFYLDALLGLIAVRTHSAERSVRREHDNLLVDWAQAGINLQAAVVMVEGLQSLIGFGLAAWLLLHYLTRGGGISGVLLLVYWALNLPAIGQTMATLARQYPNHRSIALRLLEPLSAPDDKEREKSTSEEKGPDPHNDMENYGPQGLVRSKKNPGVTLLFEGVIVRAAGHKILEEINLTIKAGSHVAIIGRSGAGKSSLVGILLGWHRPAAGKVMVDGLLLDARRVEELRNETAWVDPSVQLWNRSFLENLCYGTSLNPDLAMNKVIRKANLHGLLEKLPHGFQTTLGEGGALVSGGEGQRVRLGRSMLRSEVRLVILDEPFRGLDYEQRQDLLAHSRRLWAKATFLCITHDVETTATFDQVIVVEKGRIIESGSPKELLRQANSRYQAMMEAEKFVRKDLWSDTSWRRLRLEEGHLTENNQLVNET